jgi:hypothetical protein
VLCFVDHVLTIFRQWIGEVHCCCLLLTSTAAVAGTVPLEHGATRLSGGAVRFALMLRGVAIELNPRLGCGVGHAALFVSQGCDMVGVWLG